MPTEAETAAELREWQVDELTSYLEFARDNTGLFGDRLADVDVGAIRSLEDFRDRVGVVRKEDVLADQEADPPHGTRLTVPEADIAKVNLTSGTSGRGREAWAATERDVDALVSQLSSGFERIGLDASDTVFNTIPIGTSAAGDWLSKAFERLGANTFNVGPYSTEWKVQLMDRFDVTAVFATPSYLDQLQQVAGDLDVDLRAETIMTATDSLSEAQIERIERQWGGTLYEEYGVTEGSSLWTCGRGVVDGAGRGTIHFEQEFGLYEVVDPDDPSTHVASGEFGELVITPFRCRRGMPLVRYATGDRVRYKRAADCPCGSILDGMESGTIGRYDDMVKIRGVNVWPQAVDEVVFERDEVREYVGTVTQDDAGRERATIEVELASDADLDSSQREALFADLESAMKSELGVRIHVTESDEALPDYGSAENKADRWTDSR